MLAHPFSSVDKHEHLFDFRENMLPHLETYVKKERLVKYLLFCLLYDCTDREEVDFWVTFFFLIYRFYCTEKRQHRAASFFDFSKL